MTDDWKEVKGPEGIRHLIDIGERLETIEPLCSKRAEGWRLLLLAQKRKQVDLAHRITSKAAQSKAACARRVLATAQLRGNSASM